MRILMLGRGAIATTYGLTLQAAGHEVEFYVRPGRAEEYGAEVAVDILDARRKPLGHRIRRVFPVRLRESLALQDGFDLVIVSLAHHQLVDAASFLAPRIGDATVLVFGNVWDEPLAAIAPIPQDQIVFGFPQAGGGFSQDGVLHTALFRSVILGTAAASTSPRELAVRAAFQQARFAVREEQDMRGWLFLHFISDAGMFSQGIRSGGLSKMIGDREAFRNALLTARELLPVLEARGVDLGQHRTAALPLRHPTPTAVVMALATARLPIAQVSLAAHTEPYAAEPRAVLRDVTHEAHRLGIRVPRLEAALHGSE